MFSSKLLLISLLTWLIWSSSASKSSSKSSEGSDISPTELSENENRHSMRPPPRFGKRLSGQKFGVKFYKHHYNHHNHDEYQLNYDQFDNQDKLNYNPVTFHLNPVKFHLKLKQNEHQKARFTGLKLKSSERLRLQLKQHFNMINHDVKCFETNHHHNIWCGLMISNINFK